MARITPASDRPSVPCLLKALIMGAALLLVLASAPAEAKTTDYFDRDASGTAIYEAMVIAPPAVYDEPRNTTWITYQGYGLDPYLAGFDHATSRWQEPTRIGDNPLVADTHGGTSSMLDADNRLHAFFGAHGTAFNVGDEQYSLRETVIADPTKPQIRTEDVIRDTTGAAVDATYPQPVLRTDGSLRLFLRSGHTTATPEADGYYDWGYIDYLPARSAWSTATVVIDAQRSTIDSITAWDSFYVNFFEGAADTGHAAITFRDLHAAPDDAFERRGLYYLTTSDDGTWCSADGSVSVDASGAIVPWTKASLDASCAIDETMEMRVNQVVVKELPDGSPVILFLAQRDASLLEPLPAPTWSMARIDDGEWSIQTICETDNLFDAGDFVVQPSGDIEAFLVTGGEPDETSRLDDPFASRGGDIIRWHYSASTGTWTTGDNDVIIRAKDASVRYNNPQVLDGPDGSIQLTFSEWNNDATSFVHRVYLCESTETGVRFRYQEITPEQNRLWGNDRIETAIQASRAAFPTGFAYKSDSTVIIATSRDFADALASTSLCTLYNAPLLLNPSTGLDERVAEEIKRLKPQRVIILGGTTAISDSTRVSLKALSFPVTSDSDVRKLKEVSRIQGANRYETAANIARRLIELKGPRSTVVITSGENYPDGLSVAGLAGRKGYPLLLTKTDSLPAETLELLNEIDPSETLIVGGTAAVSQSVETSLNAAGRVKATRIGGMNRYETAQRVAELAYDRGMGPERLVIASGESFPDAMTGGWMAARYNAVLIMTRPDRVPAETAELLSERFISVTDTYIVGGPTAVGPDVASWFATGIAEE